MNQQRLKEIPLWAASLVQKKYGDRIAQETASNYTKQLLVEGKSAATALWDGVNAGIKAIERQRKTDPITTN